MLWILLTFMMQEPALEPALKPEKSQKKSIIIEDGRIDVELDEGDSTQEPSLQQAKPVKRPFLGIYAEDGELTPLLKEHLGIDHGWVVGTMVKDGPAEKAGLKSHDIILSIDGKRVESFNDIQVSVRSRALGDTVVLECLRAGKAQKIEVVLGETEDAGLEVRVLELAPEFGLENDFHKKKLDMFRMRQHLEVIPENLEEDMGRLREMLKRNEMDVERHAKELEKLNVPGWDGLQDDMRRFREEIERELGKGPGGIPRLRFHIKVPELPNIPEGAEGKSFFTKIVVDEGTYIVAGTNGEVKITVHNANGKVLLNEGSAEDAAKLPEPYAQKVKNLLDGLK